jgi:hypothetical protein
MRGFHRRTTVSTVKTDTAPFAPAKLPANAEGEKQIEVDAFSGLPLGTSAWIGALGVTAALAAAGFIAKLSLQQFLGIELGNWSAVDLSIFAGRWAIDTLSIILGHLLNHPIQFGVPILLYLLPTLISFSLPQRDRRGRIATRVSILFATCGLIFALTWAEMPTLSFKDWLISPLHDQLNDPDPGLLKSREADLRVTLLVSKMDGIAEQGTVCEKSGQELPDNLRPHLTSRYPAVTARNQLENLYAACVIICLTSMFTLYFHRTMEEPRLIDEGFRALRLLTSLLLLPLVASLIPYMYGKLLYPTTFPQVTVTLSDKDAPPVGKGTDDRLLVMDETDKDVSLLSTATSVPYMVKVLHRDDIKSMQRYGSKDVLNTMLLHDCDWLSQ